MNNLNIVFAGTPEFGIPCLEAIRLSSHNLKAIYTQPDRPAGRGRKIQPSAIKKWAFAQQIPVYQPENFKSQESIDQLAALNPDVMIVIAYGLILPKTILAIPKFGCINVHASLLPRWRGASPIQQAILHGDQGSGVTIMQMDKGMDTGDILRTQSCPITPTDTATSLHDKLALIAAQPLLETLDDLVNNHLQPQKQDDNAATYAPKINKEDARINWEQSAVEIDRLIRAFNPWPIAYTSFGKEVLRVHQAVPITMDCRDFPGTILHIDKKGILVSTSRQALLIEKIQFPGGKAIFVADWINSGANQLRLGTVLQ